MEYKKIITLLDNTLNQPSKFSIQIYIEINDELWGTHDEDIQNRFKSSMLRSSLCSKIVVMDSMACRGIFRTQSDI